jgi:hypothetical protein
MDLVFQYYSEEIRDAEEKEEKQLLFTPSIGISILFLIFISMGVSSIIIYFTDPDADFGLTIVSIGFIALFTWMWYALPVFIFTEDSVQIKSHLFYLLGIDRKTIIRYADITSVSPNMNAFSGWGGDMPILISMNGTIHNYITVCYDGDTIAKIYLRFREKLGDKVKIP